MTETTPRPSFTERADITTGQVHDLEGLRPQNPDNTFKNEVLTKAADRIVQECLTLTNEDRLVIMLHPTGWQLASMVAERARAIGAQVVLRIQDPYLEKIVLEGMETEFALPLSQSGEPLPESYSATPESAENAFLHHGLYEDQVQDAAWATKFVTIRNKKPHPETQVRDDLRRKAFEISNTTKKFRGESKMVTLVYMPNLEEAEAAEITLDEYTDQYFGAAERDWEKAAEVQQKLVEILSNRKEIRVKAGVRAGYPADWYTDITMNVEGQVPLSSFNKGNYPGGEVFYAPNAGSLEGVYSIPYPIKYEDRMLPNLRLVFKQGRVESFSFYYPPGSDTSRQAEDYAEMERILSIDDGAKVVGEIGFGTNPLIKYSANSLMAEKAKGSIHLALGNAYGNKPGREARTDNGNRSLLHWDITRLMLPEYGGGSIEADGEVIQQDGTFLHPDLQDLETEAAKSV